jgi:pantothenate synthetase
MPIGGLFIGEGDAQQCFLAERFADDLHADRQIVNKAGRYRDSRYSSYVYG